MSCYASSSCHSGCHHHGSNGCGNCGSCGSCNNGCNNGCNTGCTDCNHGWHHGCGPNWAHPWKPCCDLPYCPYPEWVHPLLCNCTHWCSAETDNGPTLVIHQILLEPCGDQSCTPRTFQIRVTGPSYPDGEVFSLRAGSCTEIDEPLVITNLTPGTYCIEQISTACPPLYDTTITGPIFDGCVTVSNSRVPTVVTIVSRKRLNNRCRRRARCGCASSCC